MPSQRRSAMSAVVCASRLRSVSVSSMRSRKRPPARRASSRLNSAVRAFPRCSSPVGLGAKRVTHFAACAGGEIALALIGPAAQKLLHCCRNTSAGPVYSSSLPVYLYSDRSLPLSSEVFEWSAESAKPLGQLPLELLQRYPKARAQMEQALAEWV